MEETYDINSEFDIQRHKETFVHYLEVLIDADGKVMYAVPSHQEKAIRLACLAKGMTRRQLEATCPPEMYFDFLEWVLSLSGAVAVWEMYTVGKLNQRQINTLRKLKMSGLYKGAICREQMQRNGSWTTDTTE